MREKNSILKMCTCETCRYTFRDFIIPPACPDCGKDTVRKATASEVREYHKYQKILAEEIRLGLYGAV